MKKIKRRNLHIIDQKLINRLLFLSFFLFVISSVSVTAQKEEEMPIDVAPPPLKLLSKDEKTSLEAQGKNIKKRTTI